jgi:hypothetical protein
MPKVNQEKASDATINPPHPGDPTSDVTRTGGEPLHKPPQEGAWQDADGNWHAAEEHQDYVVTEDSQVTGSKVKAAAVPGTTGRDAHADGKGGAAQSPYVGTSDQSQELRDDPMPDNADERVKWAQRGATPGARINAALRSEEARSGGGRPTVLRRLKELQREAKRNDEPTQDVTAKVTDDSK